MSTVKRAVGGSEQRRLDRSTAEAIVFGTRIARSVGVEDPDVIVQVVRDRIWNNLSSFFSIGDWPDRARTPAEIDEES